MKAKIWAAKQVFNGIAKIVKKKKDKKELDGYRNLSVQVKQLQKTVSKQGRYIEELEKEVAILKSNSHPPVFFKSDYKNILKKLEKLENAK